MVQNHVLGSGKWFGTDLDHTGCIRNDLGQIKKMISKKSFWGDFAPKYAYGMVLSSGDSVVLGGEEVKFAPPFRFFVDIFFHVYRMNIIFVRLERAMFGEHFRYLEC